MSFRAKRPGLPCRATRRAGWRRADAGQARRRRPGAGRYTLSASPAGSARPKQRPTTCSARATRPGSCGGVESPRADPNHGWPLSRSGRCSPCWTATPPWSPSTWTRPNRQDRHRATPRTRSWTPSAAGSTGSSSCGPAAPPGRERAAASSTARSMTRIRPAKRRPVCLALFVRLGQLLQTAAGRRPGSRRGRRPGDDRPAGRIHRGPRTVRSRALTARTKREDAPSATRNRHAPGGLGAEQDLWSVTSSSSGIEHHAGQQRGRTEQDELLRTRPHEVARTELNADRERGGTQADGRRQPAHTAQRRPCR